MKPPPLSPDYAYYDQANFACFTSPRGVYQESWYGWCPPPPSPYYAYYEYIIWMKPPPLPLTMPIMNTYMIWMNPQPPGLCLSWIYDLSVVNILIIFFIFDNSHCTHGMSCVNNPYYIGDRTQFIGEAKIQRYIGNRCKSHTLIEQNSVQWKNHKKITLAIHN